MMRLALPLLLFHAACGNGAGTADGGPPDAPPPAGTVALSWEIAHEESELDCSRVGASIVRLVATEQSASFADVDALSCGAGSGTFSLDPGTYRVELDLRAGGGLGSLLETPVVRSGVEVHSGQVTDLGSLVFEVEPRGEVSFMVHAPVSGGQCESAAITEMLFELRDAEQTCVPATFEIEGMAPFENDCEEGTALEGCVEAGALIEVTTDSGPHLLEVIGRRSDGEGGTIDCYGRTSQPFTIPGNGLRVELGTLLLLTTDDDPACE